MIKFNVLNRYSGKVQFTAEIDCDENESRSIKLGLAVKWAIKNNANLRSVDLRYADLRHVNLRFADLRFADLRYADLSYVDLHYADLRSAHLSSAKNLVAPVTFGPVGKELRTGYAIYDNSKIMVRIGCFYGTEKEAIAAINKKYGKGSSYAQMVSAACRVAKERGVWNPTERKDHETNRRIKRIAK